MDNVNRPFLTPVNSNTMSPTTYGSVNGQYSSPISIPLAENASIGKMSVSRRFFILLTVFDVLFTSLVWIVCTVISYDASLAYAFEREVMYYTIKSSLFDIVILASLRAFFIILFYAVLRISHWWVISITTAGSGAFIVAKVLLYMWGKSTSKTASVVLILYSFVISWVEAWFLDCRVVPNELKAMEYIGNCDPEQALLGPHSALSRSQSDDGSAFYSPPISDNEEDNEKENDGSTVSEVEWLSPKNSNDGTVHPSPEEYRAIAEEALESALNIMRSDGWVEEKAMGDDIIYTKNVPKYGKVYKFVGTVSMSPAKVIDVLYYKGEEMHKWNPTVKKVKIIQKIDDYIDVTHVIAKESAGGLVNSRDFVNVRIWKVQGPDHVHALTSTTHANAPVVSKYVRGEQGPSAYILTPLREDSNKCIFQWLLNTNLKGWLPQYLIDQTLSSVMFEYVEALRRLA